MKKMSPLQFSGALTIVVFTFFIKLQHTIPSLRRFDLAETVILLGSLLCVALFGVIPVLLKRDVYLKKTLGILNLMIAVFWGLNMYCILTFPKQN